MSVTHEPGKSPADVKLLYDSINDYCREVESGGRGDMHIGHFLTPTDDQEAAASNAVLTLANFGRSLGARFAPNARVVDLGSGLGGTAHTWASTFGCHVTCLNLVESQNEFNRARAQELGLSHLIDVVDGSFDALPVHWDGRFDVVTSVDAMFHALDKNVAAREMFRVCRAGGMLVFSDTMAGMYAPRENIDLYRTRNRVTGPILTLWEYERAFEEAGFVVLRVRDRSANMLPWLRRIMVREGSFKWEELKEKWEDVLEKRLVSYKKSMERLVEGEGQSVGTIVAVKPKEGEENKYRSVTGKAV